MYQYTYASYASFSNAYAQTLGSLAFGQAQGKNSSTFTHPKRTKRGELGCVGQARRPQARIAAQLLPDRYLEKLRRGGHWPLIYTSDDVGDEERQQGTS